MQYEYHTADVFTDRTFGGNQLAVLPDATGLTTEQMQLITREFNYSETVFVLPPENPDHTCRLRIFTPGGEIPFAGHPTVGTAHVLASIGNISLRGDVTDVVFEEGVGPIPVRIRAEAGTPYYAQLTTARLPEFGPEPPPAVELADMLSLDVKDLLGDEDADVQAVSCGVPFLYIPLRDRDAVGRAQPNRVRFRQVLGSYWTSEVFVFSYDPEREDADLHARMFAPALGIEEDPATGAAASALAGYLGIRDSTSTGTLRWRVEQGVEMGRPSLLDVEADKTDGDITAVRVGGKSVLVSRGVMTIPSE